jgi:hypothetical protein
MKNANSASCVTVIVLSTFLCLGSGLSSKTDISRTQFDEFWGGVFNSVARYRVFVWHKFVNGGQETPPHHSLSSFIIQTVLQTCQHTPPVSVREKVSRTIHAIRTSTRARARQQTSPSVRKKMN